MVLACFIITFILIKDLTISLIRFAKNLIHQAPPKDQPFQLNLTQFSGRSIANNPNFITLILNFTFLFIMRPLGLLVFSLIIRYQATISFSFINGIIFLLLTIIIFYTNHQEGNLLFRLIHFLFF